jgi:hypothetical protein
MSQAALDKLRFLRGDLAAMARECLKIRTKAGQFVPFEFNDGQMIVHAALEAQRLEFGWVRAQILKQRQGGISTYIAARYYHKTSLNKGVNTYILSHEQSSSDALFSIVDRYQRNNPFAPHVGVANIKELVFDRLESTYQVATAGAKEGGRGRSISLFHGSEVAFWNNAPAHFAASVQAVPLEVGTEVVLESTSNGPSGEFYERWQDCEAGKGDYIPIFLPWFVSKEYARPPPIGFELTREADEGELSEEEYRDLYKLSLAQMAWRRAKIVELRSATTFKREYPADPSEAWTAKGDHEPFIDANLVLRARKRQRDAFGPKILGIDPASGGGDRFAVALRQGLRVPWVRYRNKIDHLEAVEWVDSLIQEVRPDRVFIDAGNIGSALITTLKAKRREYQTLIVAVNFGGTSQAKLARPKNPGPKNRRAEMWARSLEWLQLVEGVQIPDDHVLQSDATGPRLKPSLTNDTVLESKGDMKARGVRSPDLWDSVALTFASTEFIPAAPSSVATTSFGLIDGSQSVTTTLDPFVGYGGGGWMA